MIITITANWRPIRQRISFCDLFGLPPRSMLISPSKSTIVTAPMPIATIRLLAKCILVILGNKTWLALSMPERLPYRWTHLIEKEPLRFKELEHVLIEKVEQLFRNML